MAGRDVIPGAPPDNRRRVVRAQPLNLELAAGARGSLVTPVEAHFVRSHFVLAPLGRGSHRVELAGALAQPGSLSLAGLRALGERSVTVTLECAGNGRLGMRPATAPPGEPWGDGAVSTAQWRGVPLGALLTAAGLRDDVVELLVEGADRGQPEGATGPLAYGRALPLDKALEPDTLLAWEMNGRPLLHVHGAPLRLVVPGWYGMASVKWVTRIVALTEPYHGYFQATRYVYRGRSGGDVPVTTMRPRALLVAPAPGAHVPAGRVRVWGWAWSGAAPIARVLLTLDGSHPPFAATLAPAPFRWAWTRFSAEVVLRRPGRHHLVARAEDARGERQPDRAAWNVFGYGNNGVSAIAFDIV